jgi:hypothetical protein
MFEERLPIESRGEVVVLNITAESLSVDESVPFLPHLTG